MSFDKAQLALAEQVRVNNLRAIAAKERAGQEDAIATRTAVRGIVKTATSEILAVLRPPAKWRGLRRHDYQPYTNPKVNPGCVQCPHGETHEIHKQVPARESWVPVRREFTVGVVYTVGAGREENIDLSLRFLLAGQAVPRSIVIVLDGPDVAEPTPPPTAVPIKIVRIAKHEPGHEQPRNVGVRHLPYDCTYVWFLDSDVLVEPSTLTQYIEANKRTGDAILIGPYEWMNGSREPQPDLRNDPRWQRFERCDARYIADMEIALACFSGNLVWPIGEFKRIGGFHPQLYHGRCEDGELGLRAASARIPMTLVPAARGYHLLHAVNHALVMERNQRDIPLINAWHPWVQQQGLVVTDEDGARFDFICECGAQVNTLEMWAHMAQHRGPR